MSQFPREAAVTPHGAGSGVLESELAEQECDPYLISLVRGGDADAFGKLYERHVSAARRLARVLVRDPSDVDDLVAETFTRVLSAMRGGRGPDTAFRAYLLTSLKHTLYDRIRRDRRIEFTDDLTPYERASIPDDPLVKTLESSYAARAFARLPERWRTVLWHTEVEGETPAQVAPLLGLTPNGVAALAYRARERLRQMYLQEHIDVTSSPRCHWTGTHLAGYVRAQLPRRDRSKVEDHLAECAECRLLHRELTEENSELRGVLATLLLGSAATGYLSRPVRDGASLLAAIPATLALLWQHAIDWCAWVIAFAVSAAIKLRWLPRRLVERFGASNVAAASGVAAAGLTGVAVFAGVLVSAGDGTPSARPRPAPHQPPAIALPTTPAPTAAPIPPPPTPPGPPPTTSATGGTGLHATKPQASIAAMTGPLTRPIVAYDPSQARLTAGEIGTLPIAVRMAESSTESSLAEPTTLGVRLPAGMHLAAPEAGDGWACRGTGEVTCARAESGSSSVARIPVRVDAGVSGFQPVPVTLTAGPPPGTIARQTSPGEAAHPTIARQTPDGGAVTVLRVPVAPGGMRVGYAASGPVGFTLGGNTLLACQPRPTCLAHDNNDQEMLPSLPTDREPTAPRGLLEGDGTLPGPKAASGARLELPRGARIRWAGLTISASTKVAPTVAAVSGPGGGWYPLKNFEKNPSGQAFADVTQLVSKAGGGDWWVATRAGELPAGLGAYAGWSLAVVYDKPAPGDAEVAVYLGPRPLREAQEVSVRVGEGGGIDLGLVVWDGDRTLADDTLTLDNTPIGDATNAAGGSNASTLSCALSPALCPWRTPGLDVLRHKGVAERSGIARLRSGRDPMTVGMLVLLAES